MTLKILQSIVFKNYSPRNIKLLSHIIENNSKGSYSKIIILSNSKHPNRIELKDKYIEDLYPSEN